MTFWFSITLQLPSSYFIHNAILSRKLFHSLHLVCHYPAAMSNMDCFMMSWCFLCYTGLRKDPFGSQCFIRHLYTMLCYCSINHCVKSHGHISFSSLLPSYFIYLFCASGILAKKRTRRYWGAEQGLMKQLKWDCKLNTTHPNLARHRKALALKSKSNVSVLTQFL